MPTTYRPTACKATPGARSKLPKPSKLTPTIEQRLAAAGHVERPEAVREIEFSDAYWAEIFALRGPVIPT